MAETYKILHITAGSLHGGAARGAYWLHKALVSDGVHSRMLLNNSEVHSDPDLTILNSPIYDRIRRKFLEQSDKFLLRNYRNRSESFFSPGLVGMDVTSLPVYKWADLIHLHWINAGFLSVNSIAKIQKPVVWTLRDMWAFTGGCHYAMHCEKYQEQCGSCPILNSKQDDDLSRRVLLHKGRKYPPHIYPIGISKWISDQAQSSWLFRHHDIRTIPNGIDTGIFFPEEKSDSRKMLGIAENKKIILAGAQNVKDDYKGFDKFLEALRLMDPDEYQVVLFGKSEGNAIEELGFSCTRLGFVTEPQKLRQIYSAADVFVAPSVMEAFGKTIAEAMACATPVVCFDATGPRDIVCHRENGYKAIPFSTQDLADGIAWVAGHPDGKALGAKARAFVLERFDSMVTARQYKKLYHEIHTRYYSQGGT